MQEIVHTLLLEEYGVSLNIVVEIIFTTIKLVDRIKYFKWMHSRMINAKIFEENMRRRPDFLWNKRCRSHTY